VEISRREFLELKVQPGDSVYIKLANSKFYPTAPAEISPVPEQVAPLLNLQSQITNG
jgi:hypothetical protein